MGVSPSLYLPKEKFIFVSRRRKKNERGAKWLNHYVWLSLSPLNLTSVLCDMTVTSKRDMTSLARPSVSMVVCHAWPFFCRPNTLRAWSQAATLTLSLLRQTRKMSIKNTHTQTDMHNSSSNDDEESSLRMTLSRFSRKERDRLDFFSNQWTHLTQSVCFCMKMSC